MATPKLRFKEFDGDWTRYKIAEVTEYLVDGTHFSPKTTEGEFKYITSKNIRNDGLDLTNISYISKDEHETIYKRCKVQLGDILLTKDGANTGNCCLNTLDEEFSLLSSVAVLRGKKDSFNNNFILQILQSDLGQNTIISSMSGQAITRITLAKLKDYSFFFPELTEQTKIASFLSAVDEKISQLTQKHSLLSQYKQGMMQKLFSQQIRFKADDGSEFGEWEETSLHTFLCESLIKGSKGNKAKKLTVKLWGKGVIPKNEAFQGSENTQYYKRSAGQLIYGKLDFLNCAFGLIPEYLDGFESTIDAPAFDIDNKIVHPYFLINRFLQKDFYQKNGEEADGSRKAKRINQSVFLAMQIGLPSLEEQTKIANFLSAIDQKIEVMAQQIEQAKTWKKGLLQQMFV
ncbi:hypothetical protein F970_01141 [Acinetobacter sp. CIP 102082]|uniref:restriction endonuclease subunit S n=1 Tax=unclassified Acinetobacter TaxID=196816 RepID=UPI0002CD992B|nr:MULTISPECIES: restriction endonuclease subunit S [unclassified Acinetobacter]ENU96038.1 hypothetical protein F970_01141 [Acinetobacter sp. CIP 102082]ENX62374.1 hypothetical protein F884_02528 [Acinetobacter sp. CIP 102143]